MPSRLGFVIAAALEYRPAFLNQQTLTMGFLTNMISAAFDIVVTPIAAVKDVVDTMNGDTGPSKAAEKIESAVDKTGQAVDDLIDGDVL